MAADHGGEKVPSLRIEAVTVSACISERSIARDFLEFETTGEADAYQANRRIACFLLNH